MQELDEIKRLRKQIREILLNTDNFKDKSITAKEKQSDLKKNCYNDIVDLKNEFESVKEISDKEGTISKIDSLMANLKKLKTSLGNQL